MANPCSRSVSQPNRHSFCRFLGRGLEDKLPDARTIWLFRAQLTRHERHKTLFERFDQQGVSQGCRARKGQGMDAGFMDVPRQRNSREENAQLKAGETPERFEANPSVKSQKDTQARWARKHQETHPSAGSGTTLATRITLPSITNTS